MELVLTCFIIILHLHYFHVSSFLTASTTQHSHRIFQKKLMREDIKNGNIKLVVSIIWQHNKYIIIIIKICLSLYNKTLKSKHKKKKDRKKCNNLNRVQLRKFYVTTIIRVLCLTHICFVVPAIGLLVTLSICSVCSGI